MSQKTPLSLAMDKLFFRLTFCLICFAAGLAVFHRADLSLLSAVLALLIFETIRRLSGVSQKKQAAAEEAAQKSAYLNQLMYHPKSVNLRLFCEIARKKDSQARIKTDFVLTEHAGKTVGLFPLFPCGALSPDQVLEVYRRAQTAGLDQAVVLTSSATAEAVRFAAALWDVKVVILGQNAVWKLLKTHSVFPKLTTRPKEVQTPSGILRRAFSRKRFKGYFFSGLGLFALSFFTPFRIYYLVAGGVLLTMALLCLALQHKLSDPAPDDFFLY